MLAVRFSIKAIVDPGPVQRSYARAERSVLVRTAARARVFARNRMRRRSRASRPGEGPTVRGGQLKRFMLFAYEADKHVSVMGPRLLAGANGDTPEVLEKGLTAVRRVGRGANRRRASVRYEARPTTAPAQLFVIPQMPGFWAGAVR
jgi:hypothetical protein